MKRVLITGAAGSIVSRLRETPRGEHLLWLSDVDPVSELAAREEFPAADTSDAGYHCVSNVYLYPCPDRPIYWQA